jgi:transcriptional regulator GlxA family with amidase domain
MKNKKKSNKMQLSVCFILLKKFTLLPFSAFLHPLRHAADTLDRSRQIFCSWKILSDTMKPITSSCETKINPHGTYNSKDKFDYIVIAGGLLPYTLDINSKTKAFIFDNVKKNIPIITLCTGSFVLAKLGLLNGKHCAVHPFHMKEMQNRFPEVIADDQKNFIETGNFITSQGGITSTYLAFHLITKHCGQQRAIKGANSILIQYNSPSHNIATHEFSIFKSCGNNLIEKAIYSMEHNFNLKINISSLSTSLNTTERSLSRSFKNIVNNTPSNVWRKIKLLHCKWLLTNTSKSITNIAFENGFTDSAHFSKWFFVVYKETPSSFRKSRLQNG